MKRLTREDVRAERVLYKCRSVAVLGASGRAGDRTHAVVEYLKRAGYDVQPVRSDRADVAGLRSWARLEDVPGSVDLVLALRGRVDADLMEAARRKRTRAVWLEPGATFEGAAPAAGPVLVRRQKIVDAHRATEQVAGHPRKLVAGRSRRTRVDETDASGWAPQGGGGKRGGGGGRAVLDEKKMVRSSPRSRGRA